ncbi:GNAT family N-acetyltransferase [Clostridiaceae bacterium M8S5]|nr:GNAT family N-acetyltransferase [Clostridiaceae bacterium M8S5]
MKLYKNENVLKDGHKLIVRTAEESDSQALIDFLKIVDSETKFLAREPGEFNFTLEQEREFIAGMMKDDNRQLLIGEIDGIIVANCSVGIVVNNKRYLHRANMGISVRKKYWNKGIGKIMMNECIKWCKEKGIEQLELEVVTENSRAISLYKRLGFQEFGTKKNALKYSDGTYADEYYMILFLE